MLPLIVICLLVLLAAGLGEAVNGKYTGKVNDDTMSDDFVLEHVINYKDKPNLGKGSFKTNGGLFETFTSSLDASSLFQRLMWMKMFRMAAPKGQGTHRIKYYRNAATTTENNNKTNNTKEDYSNLLKSTKTTAVSSDLYPAYDDPETVANFAKMTSNAYFARVFGAWRNVTDYDTVDGFGWEEPGLRGYIFVNRARDIVIVSFKGTSILLAGGDTVNRDKDQDNKMFSCCCGRVDVSWVPVCGCYSGGYLSRAQTCSNECLKSTLQNDQDSYFLQAQSIVDQIRQIYPTARLWFTGHSLGGAIANIMALANEGTASIAFEAPGDLLYAQRMGLVNEEGLIEVRRAAMEEPSTEDNPNNNTLVPPIWNFGVSTDPIFMGRCNGLTSSCYMTGYALETACHTGYECTWVREGREDIGTHRIDWVLDNVVLAQPPPPHPVCIPVKNCKDCQNWNFTD